MGRRSREIRERWARRFGRSTDRSGDRSSAEQVRNSHIAELENKLKDLSDGEYEKVGNVPSETRESHLEDIVAFESVGSGPSLFQGLEQNGVNLPSPEKLDERQCVKKITEVFHALAKLGVLLVGYERMAPRELYSTLWNQTLWEGCYVKKRTLGAVTFMDVSHNMSRSDWKQFMKDLYRSQSVQ